MKGGRRQASQSVGDILRRDRAGFRDRFADKQIGEDGAGRNGCDATLRPKARSGESAVIEAHGKPQDVSADGIGYFYCRGGVRKIAGIVRASEVLENLLAKHLERV